MKPTFKVIIAGTRQEPTEEKLNTITSYCYTTLRHVLETHNVTIISGCAKGIDTVAITFAKTHNLPCEKFPANWDKYGKSAGMRRNEEMLQHADALIAFPSKESIGTRHMIKIAKEKGIPVRVMEI